MLIKSDVNKLVYYWFKKLTDHAPIEEMIAMLSKDDLYMKFPETDFNNIDGFNNWYHAVTNKFFDQIHNILSLDISIESNIAKVTLVVNWQAKSWDPPEGYSKWVGVNAHQSWIVVEDSTGRPVIKSYKVEAFDDFIKL